MVSDAAIKMIHERMKGRTYTYTELFRALAEIELPGLSGKDYADARYRFIKMDFQSVIP
ncbi:hypothetical protein FCMLKIFP_00088 [Pseudomonas phage Ka3]|uniref:Uncharacterized protein n=1 Tax=Pseudomonas phage KPP21 TaxID=1678082 RepID=A0A0H5BI85_BPK21|nr:hypothetical protein AVU12_gp070 [Pseudomonas phage KPP21]UNI72016.1 hypothetical protein [Pseudomonas phage vB_PaeP_TUMS_P10]WQZ52438.1 hypothetical protein FCMLKIFP_00088 [Pseudomonas phage Ka3]BAR94629.1 hypothetical protein [Pseudomonas phage KPP21]